MDMSVLNIFYHIWKGNIFVILTEKYDEIIFTKEQPVVSYNNVMSIKVLLDKV